MVAPLVNPLPTGHRYRVVLVERAVAEVLDSQARMIARRTTAASNGIADTPQRRERLQGEYDRLLVRTKAALSARADVELLTLSHAEVHLHRFSARLGHPR